MSELANPSKAIDPRLQLLATVSAVALLALTYCDFGAKASDFDDERPTIWIELGGQLERANGEDGIFSAPFMHVTPVPATFEPISPIDGQRPPEFSYGADGKLTFEPVGSDWSFTATIRYGRSNGDKKVHQQTHAQRSKYVAPYTSSGIVHPGQHFPKTSPEHAYTEIQDKHSESHLVLDFQAGKDIGLGLFGRNAQSTIGIGVRVAQFVARNTLDIKARPGLQVYDANPGADYFPRYRFHNYFLTGRSNRSFSGVGPSITWDASVPFAGNKEAGKFTLDWGVNAAVLFGKQKALVHHQSTGNYYVPKYHNGFPAGYTTLYKHGGDRAQARSVVVPNVGGFAGVSMKFPNAKVSFGYRADMFFGAMDDGIDGRLSKDVSFHGPFATIAVGL